MIKLEKTEIVGWEHAIRGMRNPMNSWEHSDSFFGCLNKDCPYNYCEPAQCDARIYGYVLGPNDKKLMMNLAVSGPVHAKYRRMIAVYVDITAPLYWWKEFDTYKVGTVANSCSTMHKIAEKEFTLDDFSCEHLIEGSDGCFGSIYSSDGKCSSCYPVELIKMTCDMLNFYRKRYLETKDKKYWWQMIQLLPTSYNQKRTVMMNYEVLAGVYPMRKDHKLDEWHDFCDWIKGLPYAEIIVGEDSHE